MPPPKKSGLSRAWDFANKGLISPETMMAPFGTTPQEQLARQTSLDPNEGFWERFARGAAADTASTLSSFTSPLSVALFGAGAAGKALPAAGKLAQVARGVSATAGMGFGAQGLAQAGSGAQDMYRNGLTPANVQQTLGGASQAAFAGHGAASGFKQGASMSSPLAQSIFENHQANGGATFTNKGQNLIGTPNYAVSMFPDLGEVHGSDFGPQHIDQFMARPEVKGLLDKGAAVGTWNDTSTGQHYLDVSGVTPDRSTAVRLGQQYNQKSAFDLHGLQEVPTGGTGESIPNLPALDQRMAQLSQPAPQMVGSQAGANADTGFFQQASNEMPNASLSQKLLRAQELKAKGAAAGASAPSQPTGMDIDAQFWAHPPQDSAGQNIPPLQPQFRTFSPQEIQAPPFPHEQYNAALVQADQIKANLTRLNSQLQGFKGPQNSPLDIDPDRVDPSIFQNKPPGVLRVRPRVKYNVTLLHEPQSLTNP